MERGSMRRYSFVQSACIILASEARLSFAASSEFEV